MKNCACLTLLCTVLALRIVLYIINTVCVAIISDLCSDDCAHRSHGHTLPLAAVPAPFTCLRQVLYVTHTPLCGYSLNGSLDILDGFSLTEFLSFFPSLLFFFVEMGFHYVDQTGLELTL